MFRKVCFGRPAGLWDSEDGDPTRFGEAPLKTKVLKGILQKIMEWYAHVITADLQRGAHGLRGLVPIHQYVEVKY